jgi:hypothetical protein
MEGNSVRKTGFPIAHDMAAEGAHSEAAFISLPISHENE